MDHPFGFSEEISGPCPQFPTYFPNPMNNQMNQLPIRPQSVYYKTRMCVRFMSGFCPKGNNCNFAHSIEELRRPLGNRDWRAFFPQEDRNTRNEQNPRTSVELFDLREDQKMQKNKICRKFYNGEICPYGDQCSFSHVEPSFLQDNLASIPKSLCWKTKICHKWSISGNCPYGDQCSYAHGDGELRKPGGDNEELAEKIAVAAPPSKHTPNSSDDILSKTKIEPREPAYFIESQPKIRALTLKKISRIYGDWIDDKA